MKHFLISKRGVEIPQNEKGVRQFSADQLDRGKNGALIAKWRLNAFPDITGHGNFVTE